MGEGSSMPTDPHHTPIITQPLSSQPQKKHKSRRSKEKVTQVPQSSVPSDPTKSLYLGEYKDCSSTRDYKFKEESHEVREERRDASKQRRKINDIDADEDITLKNVHDAEMFDVNDLHGDDVVKPKVTTATTTTTLGILLQEPSESIPTTTTTTTIIPSKEKGKERAWLKGTKIEESFKKEEVMEESSSKKAVDELEQENAKKQNVDDDQEAAKMKELMKIIPDKEEVAVDAIPLATKPLSIVDWKIVKEGKISYFQIIRADRSSKRYSSFIQMLRSYNREDLENLWKLVKPKHGYTRPEDGYERVL
ncbi:hypothetical protein Tco_1052020 [Tanacetum coccineum]